jgi:hypothetical protein
MRPQALLGQMMWYAIHIIRYTHRSELEQLIAVESINEKTSEMQSTKIQDVESRYVTALPCMI